MGLYIPRDRLCLLQLSDGNGDAHLIKFDNKGYNVPNLKQLLLDESRCKIFHFARFDLAIIKYYLNIAIQNIYCTKIASRLARTYTDTHGLRDLCRDMLSVQISKQQQSSDWGEASLIKEQLEYAANDVLYLHSLRAKLNNILIRENRMELAESCFKFLPTRIELDLEGWAELDIFAH
ncbi:Ribonuclease D [Rickettsiales bacterium Ac37b]|nr:Ribonuclease D [Rickettsiales bacterium Ac37b]